MSQEVQKKRKEWEDGGREGKKEGREGGQASRNSLVGIFATEKIICDYKSRK